MLDAGGNSLGVVPLNITGLTSNGVQIFPDGMKSAGSVYDEWSGRTATKRIGVVDLGTLAWGVLMAAIILLASNVSSTPLLLMIFNKSAPLNLSVLLILNQTKYKVNK